MVAISITYTVSDKRVGTGGEGTIDVDSVKHWPAIGPA